MKEVLVIFLLAYIANEATKEIISFIALITFALIVGLFVVDFFDKNNP